jgi:7-cyano-7-deazaguanine synthase
LKAIVLFSGGLDPTVMLAMALSQGRDCFALSFDYGQRHKIELNAAAAICKHYNVPHGIIKITTQAFEMSSLVSSLKVPKNRTKTEIGSGIPNTYVPARNTIFLSYAVAQAELLNAEEIHYGPNALDNIPYPDCRPAFVEAYQKLIDVATKQAVNGKAPKLVTPFIHWDKQKIVRKGRELNVPFELTFSCYDPLPDSTPCKTCDACVLRSEALNEKG